MLHFHLVLHWEVLGSKRQSGPTPDKSEIHTSLLRGKFGQGSPKEFDDRVGFSAALYLKINYLYLY